MDTQKSCFFQDFHQLNRTICIVLKKTLMDNVKSKTIAHLAVIYKSQAVLCCFLLCCCYCYWLLCLRRQSMISLLTLKLRNSIKKGKQCLAILSQTCRIKLESEALHISLPHQRKDQTFVSHNEHLLRTHMMFMMLPRHLFDWL